MFSHITSLTRKLSFFIFTVYAAPGDDPIGKISPPIGGVDDDPKVALIKIANVLLNAVLIVAAVFVLINFMQAGYMYISAGGDPKKVSEANQKMTHTAIGLGILVLTPLVAILMGVIIFGRWDAILNPDIKTLGPTPTP